MGWIEKQLEDKLGDLAAAVALEGDRTRTELAAALGQSIRGLRVNGARPRPISANAVNVANGGRLVGWSVRAVDNGGGGTVAVNFRDRDAAGDVIAVSPVLNVGQADSHVAMPAGVAFVEALYVELVTAGNANGTPPAGVVGAAWVGAVD